MGRDHPRSRGVYAMGDTGVSGYLGSSPLARGLPEFHSPNLVCERIIPARAGFTRSSTCSLESWWDHPRSRGVYHACESRGSWVPGSSPLARGLPGGAWRWWLPGRIIPARAGFTRGRRLRAARLPDHPRSRGVYATLNGVGMRIGGSSPLARGLHVGAEPVDSDAGIIPARAGFTECQLREARTHGDHPRSRGVYASVFLDSPGRDGSSPLARGLLNRSDAEAPSHRIIPARAGFTRSPHRLMSGPRDHPRSRGVYPVLS